MTASAAPNTLTPEHWRELIEESAILPEVLAEEGIASRTSSLGLPTPDEALRHPNSHKGQYFGQWGETDKQHRPIDLGPGLWFSTRDVHGRLSGQYKPNRARTAYNGHTVKYETCRGTRPSFAVPRRCLEALVSSMCDVLFTEGIKKALALASAGACAISLAGVDSWSVKPDPNMPAGEPVEDFDAIAWRGRMVWIAYDSDAVTKPGVKYAEQRLTKELESRGAIVMVIRVPHASDGSKRGIDDYFRDRLAEGVSREDALAGLKAFAIAELQDRARARQRADSPVGSDGGETCQNCAPTRERLRAYEIADTMRRAKAFSPGEVSIAHHYARIASAALSTGNRRASVWAEETERLTGSSRATATRFHNAMRAFQEDPEVLASLPFTIDRQTDDRGHDHISLVISNVPDEPAERTTAAMLMPLAYLTRPAERAQHGGAREACPKCSGPMTRSTVDICQDAACGHVVTHPSRTVGRAPFHDETVPPPVKIGADLYAVEVKAAGPFHDETLGTSTYRQQDETGQRPTRLRPTSFVSREDSELAAGPHYQGEPSPDAPPEPAPPPEPRPPDPNPRIAYWGRPDWRQRAQAAVSGGAP